MRVRRISKYTDEFKAEALALINRNDRSFRQLAEDLGVNAWTLRDWYKNDQMVRKSKKGKDAPVQVAPAGETAEQRLARLERDNERLRKENESLKMDREILKKAAAFFAKESE
jgi:transposase